MADPVVDATIAGVSLRLRVALDGKDVVELNPAAAAKLPIAWDGGFVAEVGRVSLPGKGGVAEVAVAGRRFPAQIASHGRECCLGVDGAITPTLLPYARVRFVRARQSDGLAIRSLAMTATFDGLEFADQTGLRMQFSLERPETVATSSAGAILAAVHGGRFTGGYQDVPAAFGVARPTRLMAFATPPSLAGFRFPILRVRTSDFGGHYRLPQDAPTPGEIVVSGRLRPQDAVPIVLIGRDRLDSCPEIMFSLVTRRLDLTCRFDDAAR